MAKELLFSVKASDCEWDYFRAGGKGGQNQNKVESGVRCRHVPSGAVAESREERSQLQNKRNAFTRMAQSPKMQAWCKMEAARLMGRVAEINAEVDRQMAPGNLQVDGKENGRWKPWDDLMWSMENAIPTSGTDDK